VGIALRRLNSATPPPELPASRAAIDASSGKVRVSEECRLSMSPGSIKHYCPGGKNRRPNSNGRDELGRRDHDATVA
jgi:hypothetical protein